MSSLQQANRNHPGPVQHKFDKGELEWRHVGSGVFARTFRMAQRFVTTTKSGPPMCEVHRRVTWSLSTGKMLDDCLVDQTQDEELHRQLKSPDDVRVELTMKDALKMYEVKGADVSEIYSQPRIVQQAAVDKNLGLTPGFSVDLTMNDPMTGKQWDLSRRDVRARVKTLVNDTKPFILIGSPPCTMFSSLQNLRKSKRNQAEFQRKLEVAKKHVRFCVSLYEIQMAEGRYFLHEHPRNATSWAMAEVVELANTEGVATTTCDMCAFGMEITDRQGRALVEKAIKFLTSSPEVCRHINRRCSNRRESGAQSRVPTDEAAMPKLPGGDTVSRARGQGGLVATTVEGGRHYVIQKGKRRHKVASHEWHRHANTLGGQVRKCNV